MDFKALRALRKRKQEYPPFSTSVFELIVINLDYCPQPLSVGAPLPLATPLWIFTAELFTSELFHSVINNRSKLQAKYPIFE